MTARRMMGVAGSVVAVILLAAGPAGAEPAPFSSPLTGTLTIGGERGPAPDGARLAGTYDPATGELLADATFPETTMTAQGATLVSQVVQLQPLRGRVDGDTGQVTATLQLSFHVKRASMGGGQPLNLEPCRFQPIDLDLTGQLAADGTLDLADADFAIPPTTDTCGGFAQLVNGQLQGARGAAQLRATGLPAGVGQAPPPPAAPAPSPSPSPAVPTPAVDTVPDAAAPISAPVGVLADSGFDTALPATLAAAALLLALLTRAARRAA